ncbi:acyltransferase domain-containing protein [Streptomyces sp. NPDC087440]|uniref:acyltransferase domain-containing protein n=1 Tax=Streptomyces sp. NPDC087440 TaxID=3365790 RepID=UPI0037F24C4E
MSVLTAPRTALLFPGKGAYLPGALQKLHDDHESVAEQLDTIDRVAAQYGVAPVSPLLTDSDSPPLGVLLADDPDRLQVAIFAASLVVATLAVEELGLSDVVLVGHSVGEITALTAAGAYSVADGTRVLCERDKAMSAFDVPAGGLLAVGLSVERAHRLVTGAGLVDIDVAAVNGPRQTVLSGPDASLEQLVAITGELGVPRKRLESPHPYHHRFLEPVARHLEQALADVPVRPMRFPVHSTVHHRWYTDGDDVTALMCAHLTHPVGFLRAVRELQAAGTDFFVEAGARSALTGLARAAVAQIQTVAPLESTVSGEELRGMLRVVTALPASAAPRVVRPRGSAEPASDASPGPSPVAPAPKAAPVAATTKAPEPAPVAVDERKDREPVRATTTDVGTGPSSQAPGTLPAHGQLLADLRTLYAEALEYPEELLDAEADLEGDLGVDSIRQTEVLAQAMEQYGLGNLPDTLRITQYTTLSEVAALLESQAGTGAAA